MKKFFCNRMYESDSESGVALVAVLVMLSTVSLLVMSMVAYSNLASYGIRNDSDVLRSRYIAEGAMNRIIWLLAADNNEYKTNDMLSFDYSEYDEERFIPDGRPRELDYYGTAVKYRVENGMGGLSIDGNIRTALNNLTRVRASNEEDLSDNIMIFNTRYADYTDTNDLVGEDGMEIEEYQELEEEVKQLDLAWLAYELIIVNLPLVHSHQDGGCNPDMDALLQDHLCTALEDENDIEG